mmetsp:Transcript_25445/g.25205  ORF Transcript_25445/g.25205 Transcript_25445/m.25205 type:complete len:110 (+) Transcript_25445:466-795(+)
MHTEFQKKNTRKHFKEDLFKSLAEWKYPSEDKKAVFDCVQEIFKAIKKSGIESKIVMKALCRNFQILFPVKLDEVDSELICQKLDQLQNEYIERQGGDTKVTFDEDTIG